MGEFVRVDNNRAKNAYGMNNTVSKDIYIEFVPGVVLDVVLNDKSPAYEDDNRNINSIIAMKHFGEKTNLKSMVRTRYFPLLRGMVDVPVKGDPVLLCTFGHIKYYLGPLNGMENSPTWNDDPSFIPELIITADESGKQTVRGVTGESPNFNKEVDFIRLQKKRKVKLDFGDAVFETTGDTLIEGRHGNSLRIGSRSNNPYVFISNKRKLEQQFESINDGGLISITSHGSLQQHFGIYYQGDLQYFGTGDDIFIMGSDTIENATERIDTIYKDFNGVNDIYQYGYDEFDELGIEANQILISSDRITLNTKLDDIFISSKRDVHIGGGRSISLSANNSVVFQTPQFNIGNPNSKKMQPMVLGDTLKEVLNDIVAIFSKLQVMTQLGPQNILPITEPDIQSVTTKIESIVSSFHKIEEG